MTGRRARCEPRTRFSRAGAGRALAAFGAIPLVLALLVPTPGSITTLAAERTRLVLIDQTFVVPVDGTIGLRFEINGDDEIIAAAAAAAAAATTTTTTTDPPDDGDADDGDADDDGADAEVIDVIVTSYEPILDRDRVPSVLAGATGPALDGARFDLAEVYRPNGPGGTPLVELDVVTATGGDIADELELPVAGLYPITVDIRRDGRRLARHITFVERLPAAGERPRRSQPFGLSVVASIPDPGPEPDQLALVDARSRLVEIAQLGEDLIAPITVGIPPVVAAQLTADDDELVGRVRDALEGSEVLAVPRIQFDPSSAVAAGETDAFTRELRDGEDVLARTFPSTAVRRSAWRWDGPLSTEGASLLRDLGVQVVVLPLDDYHRLGNALPPEFTDPTLLYTVMLPDGATLAVLTVDPVSGLLDPELADDRSATEIAVELFATLVATRIQLPDAPRTAVLSTDRLDIPDADVLSVLESFVDQHPSFRFQTLSLVPNSTGTMFVNGPPREVELPAFAGVDLTTRSNRIALTRVLVDSMSSMLPDDDLRPAAWHAELDLLLSTGFDDDTADERIDAVIGEVELLPSVIVPPDPFTFTLTGSSSEITLRLGNTGTTPIRVRISSAASKLTFPEGDVEAVLQPGTTNLVIPVEPLSNGTFPVTIELLTPLDGRPVIEPIVLTARVNAITGLGQVLTGGALLVLASWWYSHFRSQRRQRSEAARANHPSNGAGSVVSP